MINYIKNLIKYFNWWRVVSKMNSERIVEDYNNFKKGNLDECNDVNFTTNERFNEIMNYNREFFEYIRSSEEKDKSYLKLKKDKWLEIFGED